MKNNILRKLPLILLITSVSLLSGCASTLTHTYKEFGSPLSGAAQTVAQQSHYIFRSMNDMFTAYPELAHILLLQ